MELRDRVIVITGASSGFGELIARRCAARGAKVVLAARSVGKLDALAEALGGPSRALAVQCDVSLDADAARLASATIAHFGRADVLLNNAGFGVFDRFEHAKLSDLQAMIEVNVYGAVRCTQAFLPHMRARRTGQIVMMDSISGLVSSMNLAFYSASKHALLAISRALLVELAGTGVRCAVICPGVAQTGFQRYAEEAKFPLVSRLTAVSAETVADATVAAIARGTHGEVVVPWYGRLLALATYPFPGVTRALMRLLK